MSAEAIVMSGSMTDVYRQLGALAEAQQRGVSDRNEIKQMIESSVRVTTDQHRTLSEKFDKLDDRLDKFSDRLNAIDTTVERWESLRRAIWRAVVTYGVTGAGVAAGGGAIIDHFLSLTGHK